MKIETIGNKFRLMEDITINDQIIPSGFVTDFATIPRWAWSIIGHPTHYLFQKASLYHDYVLVNKLMGRKDAHREFLALLIKDGVNIGKAVIMYLAIRLHDDKNNK